MMAKQSGDIITKNDFVECLKSSRSTIYNLAIVDILPGKEISKCGRFHKDAVDTQVNHRLLLIQEGYSG